MTCRLNYPKLRWFSDVSCESLRLNSDAYVELLITVVKRRITRVANGRPYAWQQDSAPCHTSGKCQKWLLANYYNCTSPNVWPSNSPDPNHMDYYVWGAAEKDVNRHDSTTKVQLIDRINAVCETILMGKCNIGLLQVPGHDWGCSRR